MEDEKYQKKISDLYIAVKTSLESKDRDNLNHLLSQIKDIEEGFLISYDNKKKEGMYFTQKGISEFIISESLLSYFKSKNPNLRSVSDLKNEREFFLKQIRNISFCDPACGSGIFLLGIIDITFELFDEILNFKEKKSLKEDIINNINGFDINTTSIKLSILKLVERLSREEDVDLKRSFLCFQKNIEVRDVIASPPRKIFEIVIGNPPYGNILTKQQKLDLKETNTYTNDIYCVFLSLALNWCNGIIGFLTPKSFLLRQGYLQFRNDLLNKSNFLKIFDIGPNMFKNVTNEVLIIIYERRVSEKKNLEIFSYPERKVIIYEKQNFDDLKVCLNPRCILADNLKKIYPYTKSKKCPYCNSNTVALNRIRIKSNKKLLNLINKIELRGDLNYINIQKFPKLIRGEEDKGLKEVKARLKKNTHHSCYFINAKEDFDYYMLKKSNSFEIEDINPKLLKGENYEYYKNNKLLIKHNKIIPQALYTEEKVCFTSSIYSLLNEDPIELKFLCAILNSAVIQFYCLFGINNQMNTTINLNQYMIRHFPIIELNREVKEIVSEKVDFITLYLKQNPKLDETIYYVMREIDKFFFDAYGITSNERKLIISNLKQKVSFFNDIYDKEYDFIFERAWTKIKRAPNF